MHIFLTKKAEAVGVPYESRKYIRKSLNMSHFVTLATGGLGSASHQTHRVTLLSEMT
jgi:hypothetical protein